MYMHTLKKKAWHLHIVARIQIEEKNFHDMAKMLVLMVAKVKYYL